MTARRALALSGFVLFGSAHAADINVPVLVPVTGVFSLEGGAQRNGALLAMRGAPKNGRVTGEVDDTAVAPDVGVQDFERAISKDRPIAVVTSMIGIQLLAMLPIGQEAKVPMLTTSGTARITEMNNPWIFRFLDRKSTRLNSSHLVISYAVFCLKKKI